jgi:hypothetical protein
MDLTKEVIFGVSSSPTETLKIATVEAEVENGTTNQPEQIANKTVAEKTSLKYEELEQELSKINEQKSSIYVKEELETGAADPNGHNPGM